MEKSKARVCPKSDVMRWGEDDLPLTWNADVFTRRFEREMEEEAARRTEAVRKDIASLVKTAKELDSVAAGEGKETARRRKAREKKQESFTARLKTLEAEIERVVKEMHAEIVADNLLISWGMTDGGEPVPLTADELKSDDYSPQFLRDVIAFCRDRSLPKGPLIGTTGASPTTSATTGSSFPAR